MDFRHLIVTCLFSKLRLPFDNQKVKENYAIFFKKTVYDGEIYPSNELDGGRFWKIEEIKENLGKGIFTPNFEEELKKVSLIPSLSK